MDNKSTLRPELVWIDGRCYRFSDSSAWSKDRGMAAYQEESMYLENDYESDQDPGPDDEIEVQQVGGKFKHSFYVAKAFFPFLIGTKGSTRKRLEIETSTSINIPKMGHDGNIVVTGPSRNKVVKARNRIDNLIETSRKKLRPTHFLSIPANTESIQSEFEKFKKSILESEVAMRGVDESVFQNPKKLHLTLGMMLLVDNTESEEAVKALERCKENIIKPMIVKNGPIAVSVIGVDYMNDDSSEVNVLYAKVHSKDDVLQALADKVVDYFSELGLLKKEYDKVKLHVTLMNTSFKKTEDQRHGNNRETFDVTRILKDHKDTKFGEFVLDTLHISQRGSLGNDGYYKATGRISV